jgi:hypothetical protein
VVPLVAYPVCPWTSIAVEYLSLRANRPSFDHEGPGTRFPCFSLVDVRAEYFVRLGAADGARRGGDRACATRRGAKTFQGIAWPGMAWHGSRLCSSR